MDLRSSTQRAIPLLARPDVECHKATWLGETCWVIKDPVGLKYYRLQPEQYEILRLLDGEKCIDVVLNDFHQAFPTQRKTRGQIQQVVLDLYQKGLALSTRPGQGHAMNQRGENQRWKSTKQAVTNVLFIRLPGIDPTHVLSAGYWLARWLFHPAVIIWAAAIILYSWITMVTHSSELIRRLPSMESLITWQSTLSVWLVIGATKIIHELGHAFACRHCKGECHEIGVAFLIFSPCLYCDVSDSWTLRSKWKRIGIALAGVYVELLMASVAFFVWWNSSPGNLNHVCFLVFVVSSISNLLFNLNPLLRLDGYYVLSDWLEVPNLRHKSSKALDNMCLKAFFGITVESERLPKKTRMAFAIYAVASALYRALLVVFISWMLYTVLQPVGLQYLGFLVGLVGVAHGLVAWSKRMVTAVKDQRDQVKNGKIRAGSVALAVSGLSIVFLFVPIPISIRAPVQLEFADVQPLYANVEGELAAIRVQPGQTVQAGQVLLEIHNLKAIERLNDLITNRDVLAVELRKHQVLGDAKNMALARESLKSIESEIVNQRSQLERQTILAPCDGMIVEPRFRQPAETTDRTLARWDGTPLDLENCGCLIENGTHLLTVAPDHRFQAVMLVNQMDVHSLKVGQTVRVKLDHLPQTVFQGRIERIGTATNFVTEEMTQASLTIATQPGSPSAANPATYQAIVSIDSSDRLLMPGVHGNARVAIDRQTAAEWIWRNVNSTFNFRM